MHKDRTSDYPLSTQTHQLITNLHSRLTKTNYTWFKENKQMKKKKTNQDLSKKWERKQDPDRHVHLRDRANQGNELIFLEPKCTYSICSRAQKKTKLLNEEYYLFLEAITV